MSKTKGRSHGSEADAKRARLLSLRHDGAHVTSSSLESLLRAARDEGVPEAFSRRTQFRARKTEAYQDTPHGTLIQALELPLSSGPFMAAATNPLAMLHKACEREPFAELMRATLARCPPSMGAPWRVVFYSDEIGLAPLGRDSRKVVAMYWSFLEFGTAALSTEEAWFVATAVRSTQLHKLAGGVSHLAKLVLRLFFRSEFDCDLAAGVTLQIGPSCVFLHARLACLISDEKALKEMLCCKGSSGLKPCARCMNAVSMQHPELARQSRYCVPISCLDRNSFRSHTDETVRRVLHDLEEASAQVAAGAMTKGRFEELERQWGWSHEAGNLFLDPGLKVGAVSVLMFDWMHVYFVTGLFNWEVFLLERSLRPHGFNWDQFDLYTHRWQFPRASRANSDIFNPELGLQETLVDHLKCSASEALSVYPVLVSFVQEVVVPLGACEREARSFLALGEVCDTLQCLKLGSVSQERLREVIDRHLHLSQLAYGVEFWKPKMHMSLHLPEQLGQHGMLLSCFVHERRHKTIKRFLQDRQSLKGFEAGLVEEVTLHHLHDLGGPWLKVGLLEPSVPKGNLLKAMVALRPKAQEILASRRVAVRGTTFCVGDVVLARSPEGEEFVGDLWLNVSLDGEHMSCVSSWDRLDAGGALHSRSYRKRESPTMLSTSQLVAPLTCLSNQAGDKARILVPPSCR